ncbi:MAG: ABC transporter substrate-binding protein [Butyrivibrio sp.]|nr:ABC transporter substrate-binding protein [Butyrivibrio sp.]
MTKFKRFAAIGLAAAMSVAAFAGCGTSSSSSSSGTGDKTEAPTNAGNGDETKAPNNADKIDYSNVGEGEGKVLNIYVWNEEFKERVEEFYPGYEKVDGTTGKIGDVQVNFVIVENKDNKYQDNLDMQLEKEDKGEASDDEKIDIFLVEADYALKYVDDPASMDITDLGITKEQIANQFTYTQDVMTSSDGKLKGLSWQGCPGVLCYNKAIAKDVLGADDPDTVQAAVKDWATFEETAQKMADKGYKIVSGFDDSYRVFSNNVSSKWVDKDGQKIVVDDAIMNWVKQTKDFTDKGYNDKTILWSDEWKAGFPADQKVFCYFGPAWLVDFNIGLKDPKTNEYTNSGVWSVCEGPQNFFWGGTWICAGSNTDNKTLVKNIMLALTTDADIMTEICKKKNDFVNNKVAMDAIANDAEYKSDFLGMNPIPYYNAGVGKIDLKYLGEYDQGCNEEFQNAMHNYFLGAATLDEAMDAFKKAIGEKYPAIKDYELVYSAE